MSKEKILTTVEKVKEFLKAVFIMTFVFVMLWFAALFSGCSASQKTTIKGKATIITVDTTTVTHNGYFQLKKIGK